MNITIVFFLIFIICCVPFGIALAMPSWKSLVSLTVVLGTFLIWLLISVSGADGVSAALSMGFIAAASSSLIFGIIIRAIILFVRSKKSPRDAVVTDAERYTKQNKWRKYH